MIGEWLARQTQPVAWVALDAGDNDPVRFWRYVITACRVFNAALGRSALAALRASQISSLENVLTTFINELAQLPDQQVLILEDYHAITSSEVNASLTFFLDHLPIALHLVLLARREPDLPLARWRTRNELSEFTAADLRFTLAETGAFLRETLQAPLALEVIARAAERTEGWAAGLRLITLALHDRSDQTEIEEFLATFSGGHRYVLEYLVGEVIATQPAAVQEFLLHTSALNRLTGSLCDTLTDRTDSALLLTQLERANLFLIPLGDDGRQAWYRYHALFAEALRAYARERLGEAAIHELLEKASRWYAARGLIEEAIETALAAQDFDRAAELIEQAIEQRGVSEQYTLGRWAAQLPEAVLHAHPLVCFSYALVVLFTSDRYAPATMTRVAQLLQVAETAWRAAYDDAHLGQALALRGTAALWQGDLTRAFAYAREALELLPVHDVFWRGVSLLNVGMEEALNGRIDTALELFIEMRALCGAAQNIQGVLAATYWLAETCAWRGEFDQAAQLYEQVLAEAVGGEEMLDDQAAAALGLALIAYEHDDQLPPSSRQHARAISASSDPMKTSMCTPRCCWHLPADARANRSRARHAAQCRGSPTTAAVVAGDTTLASASGMDVRRHRNGAALGSRAWSAARCPARSARANRFAAGPTAALNEQKPEAVLKLLEPWRSAARHNGRLRSELEILCVQALAYAGQENSARAHKTLTQALTLAQPKGYRRLFLDQGEPLAQLLQAIVPDLGKRPIATYATLLLRAFAATRSGQLSARRFHRPCSNPSARKNSVCCACSPPASPTRNRPRVGGIHQHHQDASAEHLSQLNVNSRAEAADMARQLKLL